MIRVVCAVITKSLCYYFDLCIYSKMANFTTDGKICIERELEITQGKKDFDDLVSRFDIIESCKWITENNFEKVCLQFPDELLPVSAKIYEEIKKRIDVDLYILGDTSYASCCVDTVAAMHVQGNAVIHYGHSCFSKTNIPVFTVLSKKELVVKATITKIHHQFNSDENVKLCLFYDPDYEHCKDELAKWWFQKYQQSYIAVVSIEEKPGRFLGRLVKDKDGESHSVEVLKDCICIHIGTRGQTVFNYTVSIAAREWYLHDPDTDMMERMEETPWFKRRRFLVEKCKDANTVGILVCKLAGDQTKDIISRMKQLCRVNGKKSYIVSVGKPNVAKLANFPEIDIYVMIACPENDLYGNRDFYRPLVYPFELEVALNSNREPYFTQHVTDYDELLPGRRYYCDIEQVKEGTDVSLITGKIRETKVNPTEDQSMELAEKQNWALENIGHNLQDRSWKGLEQKLGETEAKQAEEGRKGIPLQYSNEPE
ncbi:2-(3-amino-3-carboxypropyl)histidine synthase subunit 2 [Pectinophora gossypiella]|uniref:2-(3-amino-3-carboxypropyl)histidine synthase subunit 2 n=1 Tax=Pectinophora gossypiella TaxID=13191 RepID=UPI00214E553A|nr:2-(3-amino-3-carboxypropyl)histidine synthase subunit 2 [Pectinophora gossypiella]